ncbi:MAG TPA: hypothetical protein VMN99_11575 [Anaerolineales bacterium]|nr:hypothetical protein [Anaerolineales bacterium]
MKHRIFLFTSLLMVTMLFAACTPQAQATDVPEVGPTTSHGGPVDDYVSLVDALRAAGATVGPGDSVEQAFFSVTGQIIKVNGADVQVFEYESAEAMEAEAALVAPDGGSVGTSMVMWVATPHFYKLGRVLVLYVGEDAAVLDLLKSVLGEQFAGR